MDEYTEGMQYNTKTQFLLLFYSIMHTNIYKKNTTMNNTSNQVLHYAVPNKNMK